MTFKLSYLLLILLRQPDVKAMTRVCSKKLFCGSNRDDRRAINWLPGEFITAGASETVQVIQSPVCATKNDGPRGQVFFKDGMFNSRNALYVLQCFGGSVRHVLCLLFPL